MEWKKKGKKEGRREEIVLRIPFRSLRFRWKKKKPASRLFPSSLLYLFFLSFLNERGRRRANSDWSASAGIPPTFRGLTITHLWYSLSPLRLIISIDFYFHDTSFSIQFLWANFRANTRKPIENDMKRKLNWKESRKMEFDGNASAETSSLVHFLFLFVSVWDALFVWE